MQKIILNSALLFLGMLCLQSLPGADKDANKPWRRMDYGPSLNWTYQIAKGQIVYKGIAVAVDGASSDVGKGTAWMVFDEDTLSMMAAWTKPSAEAEPFINWAGVAFDGKHNAHPSIVGDIKFLNTEGPGCAHPESGTWKNPRYQSPVDKKYYGPMPREWAHFTGMYRYENKTVLVYTIGKTEVRELPGYSATDKQFTRTFYIATADKPIVLKIAPVSDMPVAVFGLDAKTLEQRDGNWLLTVPAASKPQHFTVTLGGNAKAAAITPTPILPLCVGGKRMWAKELTTQIKADDKGPGFVAEQLALPDDNPWDSWMRVGGFDFYADGKRAAVCTWNGDVWLVSGVDGKVGDTLTWQRIATGMFQPLGLKIVKETIYISCRDQIVRLHDLNGDGEIDYYENFNNDHQVTEHFHEFAMGLQTDKDGNFYYAKSARHAKVGLIPQHGTLMRVSADGLTSTIMATGFRAANGVCVNDDGTFYVTDQEGHWTPKNRINLVKEGGFYGNMFTLTKHTEADDDMEQPIVWITNNADRSPAELLHVDSPSWEELNGKLLNISYGTGKVFLVLTEEVGGKKQGGVVPLPIEFPTGTMRGRFHASGDLYVAGLFGWAGNKSKAGGIYRIKKTGPALLPTRLSATTKGIELAFSQVLDPETAKAVDSYAIKAWDLKRTKNYGSKHVNERKLSVTSAELLPDGKSVRLQVEGLAPTWGMEIKVRLLTKNNETISCVINNTIHALAAPTNVQ